MDVDTSKTDSQPGAATGAMYKYCPFCGEQLIPGHKFCGSCGQAVSAGSSPPPPKVAETRTNLVKAVNKNAIIREMEQYELDLSKLEVELKEQERKFHSAEKDADGSWKGLVFVVVVGFFGLFVDIPLLVVIAGFLSALLGLAWIFNNINKWSEKSKLKKLEKEMAEKRAKLGTLRARLTA